MISQEQYIGGKVFLRSFNDALACLRETAEKEGNQQFQELVAKRVISAKRETSIAFQHNKILPGANFKNSREVKLFQYSNDIFSKYFGGIESYTGDFKGFTQILTSGLNQLNSNV